MKCEKCGKNEATFFYRSNINGKVTETHLCGECAAKEGYIDGFGNMDGIMDDFMGDFAGMFAPMPAFAGSLLGTGSIFDSAFGGGFGRMFPELCASAAAPEKPQKSEDGIVSAEEKQQLNAQRQMNALREEMKQAVAAEKFERAAELRDQIKKLQDK